MHNERNDEALIIEALSNCKPTAAYVGATWTVLGVGVITFLFGLWNENDLILSEKGFYVAVITLGLYSAISLQKTVRDKAEGITTSSLYYSISWAALGLSITLIFVGLFNATGLKLTEKSFYMMAFTLSLFAAITLQKNIRDNANIVELQEELQYGASPKGSALDSLNAVDMSEPSATTLFGSLDSNNTSQN